MGRGNKKPRHRLADFPTSMHSSKNAGNRTSRHVSLQNRKVRAVLRFDFQLDRRRFMALQNARLAKKLKK